jgi:hypothetical protein
MRVLPYHAEVPWQCSVHTDCLLQLVTSQLAQMIPDELHVVAAIQARSAVQASAHQQLLQFAHPELRQPLLVEPYTCRLMQLAYGLHRLSLRWHANAQSRCCWPSMQCSPAEQERCG